MSKPFHLSVVTPERVVLDREADFVAFPAFDGEVGILHLRAPLVAKLGSGELRVEGAGREESYFISGGFAQMVEDRLTVLTEEAKPRADLDRAQAERDLAAARALPAHDDLAFAARARAQERARAMLRLAR